MTKKRYIKNTLEFSLEQGVKNRGEKTNLFISSKARLNRHKARVHGESANDSPPSPVATPGNSPPAPAATERQATPATESTVARDEIAGPSGSDDIKGVIK